MAASSRLATLILAAAPTVASAQTAKAPAERTATPAAAGDWEIANLDLDVTISPDDRRLSIDGRMTLELTEEKTRILAALINSRQPVMEVEYLKVVGSHGIDPASVKITTDLRAGDDDGTRIDVLRFLHDLPAGQRVALAFRYGSATESEQVIVRPGFAYASWVEAWYPTPVDSRDPADPFTGAKARAPGETRFRLPPGWSSLSNGRRAERTATPAGVVELWRDGVGTARSFAAAPFLEPQEIVVSGRRSPSTCSLPRSSTRAARRNASTRRSTCFPSASVRTRTRRSPSLRCPKRSTPSGPRRSRGSSWRRRASSSRMTAISRSSPTRPATPGWGNTVSTAGKGSHLCSESLAQYTAVLAIESVDGMDAALDFLEFSRPGYVQNQCARGYFAYVRLGVDRPLSDLDDTTRFDHTLSDAKGHWVYHMLRRRVGDEVFFGTLRALVDRYRERSMSLDDLRRAFIAAAPGADLERFFSQWLDRTGAPVIDLVWWVDKQMKENPYVDHPLESIIIGEESNPFDVVVSLRQRQPGEPYVLDLEIEIEFIDGKCERRTLHLEEPARQYALTVDRLPRAIRLDPDRRTLLWRPAYGPRPPVSRSRPPSSRADTGGRPR